jgi:3-isopropylmalate dehydrogenase
MLSTALLLRWFYQRRRSVACRVAADLIERGVKDAIAAGKTTPDLGGSASTGGFGDAVVAALSA